ncbi:MAG: VWA domain-containing protein [Pseudohongiellaceae bacterium]
MVFLTPLFLLALLAALIPIAIHLIRKEKPPKLMFSTIRFLKKTSKKLVLFQQLQQLLLLALRSLLIILLVLAFARPLINQTVARLLDADPQSAVVMLDVSMSMQYGDTFQLAKQSVFDILSTLSSGDEVALVTFSDSAEFVLEFTTDIDAIRSAIDSLERPGFGATDYLPSLRLADQLLENSRFENRAVYLISDFQASAMSAANDGWKLAPGVAFNGIDVGKPVTENLALTDLRAPEQLLEDASGQKILARVRSTGTSYLNSGNVSLSINGEIVDTQSVDLSDQSEAVVTFSADFEGQGSYTGEVRVSGDSFAADNVQYFALDVMPKIRVLLVNGEASDNWFDDEGHWFGLAVSAALQSPFELQTIEPYELSAATLRQSDVAVLLNVGNVSTSQAQTLSEFVLQGGSVLFAPADRVEAEPFNRLFADIAPARISPKGAGLDDYLVIADFDRRHPILRPLASEWSARFDDHWSLEPAADADVLMQFDSAEPALVERAVGQGRTLLFASSLDLEWNNLALQGLFLPFVHETLRHLARAENASREFQVGDSFSLAVDSPATVSALGVRGESLDFLEGNYTVSADAPGFIRATVDGESANYAINVLSGESNFARAPVTDLYDRVINSDTNPIQSRQVRTEQLVSELERPQRLWWWILCLVAILVLMEGLIANRTYR